jgi:hypothetical protein
MTIEQITQTLQTVAENQATHSANMARIEEMQAQHAADISAATSDIASQIVGAWGW